MAPLLTSRAVSIAPFTFKPSLPSLVGDCIALLSTCVRSFCTDNPVFVRFIICCDSGSIAALDSLPSVYVPPAFPFPFLFPFGVAAAFSIFVLPDVDVEEGLRSFAAVERRSCFPCFPLTEEDPVGSAG